MTKVRAAFSALFARPVSKKREVFFVVVLSLLVALLAWVLIPGYSLWVPLTLGPIFVLLYWGVYHLRKYLANSIGKLNALGAACLIYGVVFGVFGLIVDRTKIDAANWVITGMIIPLSYILVLPFYKTVRLGLIIARYYLRTFFFRGKRTYPEPTTEVEHQGRVTTVVNKRYTPPGTKPSRTHRSK